MIRIAGTPERLRPHIKTHKSAELVLLQMERGISKFKCATLTEAKLLASIGAPDVLVAIPLIGPSQVAFLRLQIAFPETKFSVLIDSEASLMAWDETMMDEHINVFVDIDLGQGRTGAKPLVVPNLIRRIQTKEIFSLSGLHCYDGHIHEIKPDKRSEMVSRAFAKIKPIASDLLKEDDSIEIVCGGSITFPIHAEYKERTLSPGTTVLWDAGYSVYEDLPFQSAAVLLARVISKPDDDQLCIDLGTKAVSSEMPHPRIQLPDIGTFETIMHNEEHMVIKTHLADNYGIGDELYAIPVHICPTVAMYDQVVVEDDDIIDTWEIGARNRQLIL
ncbi:MAG: alanine racemase [Cyclobacteriaceae bacterium]